MIGAQPNTEWLNGCVAVDERCFVLTGPDLRTAELQGSICISLVHQVLQDEPHLPTDLTESFLADAENA